MKKLLFLLICPVIINCQDSAKVLFIGNSYTYYNNMPNLISGIANSKGDFFQSISQAPGGASFYDHASNPTTFLKINNDSWDYVVLQGQSQEISFSNSQVNTQSLPYIKQISDSIYTNNPPSKILMYMTWGRENGDPQWPPISTFDEMNGRLRLGYLRMADSVGALVSPVGSAWKYVRDNNPGINLYDADGSHPSLQGSYLAACVFYAAIYRKSPLGSPAIGNISQSNANILQAAAALTVLDSLYQWNIQDQFQNTSDLKPSDNSIIIYPNPTTHNTTVRVSNYKGNFQTEVYDLIGNRLQTSNETIINLSDYARGIYLLKVTYGERVEEVKVIKD